MFFLELLEDRKIFNVFRIAVFAGAVLLSAALPMAFGFNRLLQLLVALIGVGAVLLLLRWPPLGYLAIITGGLIVRFSIGTGTESRMNLAILVLGLLLGLWIFHMVAHEGSIRLIPSRTLMPLLAFCAVAVLSFLAGQLPWFIFAEQKASMVAQVGGLGLMLLSVGAFLLVGNQLRDLRWLELLTWLFIALGSISVLINLLPGGENIRFFQRGADGSAFWVWLSALTFSQALFNRRLPPAARLALIGILLLTFWVSFGRNSRWTSGWLPSAVAIAAVLFVSGSRWFFLSIPVGMAGLVWKWERISAVLLGGDNTYSLMTRLEAWRIMGSIIKVSPIIGLGPANYYWYTPLFSILGYHVQFNSHNNYVDIVAQTGLLGLACFLWFAWEAWRMGWRLRPLAPDGFGRAYVYGALGGLAGMLVSGMLGDWILPFIYNVGFTGFRASVLTWLFLGGLLALEGRLVFNHQAVLPDGAAGEAV